MKKFRSLLICLCWLAVFVVSCNSGYKNPEVISCSPPDFTPRHEVPLAEALQGIRRTGRFFGLAENLASSMPDSDKPKKLYNLFWQYLPHAYYIPSEDIEKILEPINDTIPKGARVYVALDCGRIHLYMVPALDDTTDMRKLNAESKPFVYDFITPCPNTCAPMGPYQGAFLAGKNDPFQAAKLIACPGDVCKDWNNSDLK